MDSGIGKRTIRNPLAVRSMVYSESSLSVITTRPPLKFGMPESFLLENRTLTCPKLCERDFGTKALSTSIVIVSGLGLLSLYSLHFVDR